MDYLQFEVLLCTRLKKGLQALTYHKKGFQKNYPLA